MSKFRRLIMQANAEPEKPNLAVVTDASANFTGDKKVPVTANLKKNTKYNLSFSCTITVSKKSSNNELSIGQYACWRDAYIIRFPPMEVGETVTKTFEGIRICYSDRNASRIDAILAVLPRGYEGTATINNLVITEV